MTENRPLDSDLAQGADIANQCEARPAFIDRLPIELLERAIRLGATNFPDGGPGLKWLCTWRRVSQKWASAIDGCPTLWSYINIKHGIENLENRLAKSGTLPLDIEISSPPNSKQYKGWIQLLANHAHRWRSIACDKYFWEMMPMSNSSAPMLEILSLSFTQIPPDCKVFSPGCTHLRKLSLKVVTLPKNFDPPFELEELYLSQIFETSEYLFAIPISLVRLHRFLRASPGLRSLKLDGPCAASADDNEVPSVDLPKLETAQIDWPTAPVLHLFRAEHCAQVSLEVELVRGRPPLRVWTTLVHALQKAEELEIHVTDGSLRAGSKPRALGLTLNFIKAEHGDSKRLTYSILEDILNEAERDSPLPARIELTLLTTYAPSSNFDVGLEVLKLLQTPISQPSSGLTRWRLPHLDTLRVPDDGLPSQPLLQFVQARSNRDGSSQAPSAVTIVRVHPDSSDSGSGSEDDENSEIDDDTSEGSVRSMLEDGEDEDDDEQDEEDEQDDVEDEEDEQDDVEDEQDEEGG